MEALSSILFSLYRGTPRQCDWVIACLVGQWRRLVGDRLAAVCRPIALNDRELVVEILDDSWEEAVRSVTPDLLEKLRTATANEVKSISLVYRHCGL